MASISDSVPLLPSSPNRFRRLFSGSGRFLRRLSSREGVVGPFLSRDLAEGETVNERRRRWVYSRPVVVLDVLWNLSFVAVAAGVMMWSKGEKPASPLRVWIVGFVMQCVLHIVCVCLEYKRRLEEGRGRVEDVEVGGYGGGRRQDDDESRYNLCKLFSLIDC